MKRILFSGDRENYSHYRDALTKVFKELKKVCHEKDNPYEIIVGDARGVDTLVRELAHEYDIPCRVFKADWEKYGKAAGAIRNREMLSEEPILVIACHIDLSLSKGTKNCIEQAKKIGIDIRRIGNFHF